jgi:hypothetical protein
VLPFQMGLTCDCGGHKSSQILVIFYARIAFQQGTIMWIPGSQVATFQTRDQCLCSLTFSCPDSCLWFPAGQEWQLESGLN